MQSGARMCEMLRRFFGNYSVSDLKAILYYLQEGRAAQEANMAHA